MQEQDVNNEAISHPQFLSAEDTQSKIQPQDKGQIQGPVRKAWVQGRDEAKIVKLFVKSLETDKRACKVLKGLWYRLSLLNTKAFKNLQDILSQPTHREPEVEMGLSGRYLWMWLLSNGIDYKLIHKKSTKFLQ